MRMDDAWKRGHTHIMCPIRLVFSFRCSFLMCVCVCVWCATRVEANGAMPQDIIVSGTSLGIELGRSEHHDFCICQRVLKMCLPQATRCHQKALIHSYTRILDTHANFFFFYIWCRQRQRRQHHVSATISSLDTFCLFLHMHIASHIYYFVVSVISDDDKFLIPICIFSCAEKNRWLKVGCEQTKWTLQHLAKASRKNAGI